MAETPTTSQKKRIRSGTPPDQPKNINFGDDSGIVLDGPRISPTAKPDLKKKKKQGEDATSTVVKPGSEPNDDSVDQNNMAAPTQGKQRSNGEGDEEGEKGELCEQNRGQRIRLQARRTRTAGKAETGTDGEVGNDTAKGEGPIPLPIPKIPNRRGRPKKRTLSVDPIHNSRDVFAMLIDIKNELDIQKEDNLSIKSDMVNDISCKVEKIKTEVCYDLNVVQSKVNVQSELLHNLDKKQKDQIVRVTNLEAKYDEIEKEITNQRDCVEREFGETHERLINLESSLVEHVEVLKCNVEAKVCEQGEFQSNLEQRFSEFTIDMDIENRRLRMDLDAMRKCNK